MDIVLTIKSASSSYYLDNQFELLRLKGDLKTLGFFDAGGNSKYEELFTRTITNAELTEFIDAVKWWDYNRMPQKEHQFN